ncbi:hypothetical protein JQX13_45465 [Archangium violaceum]|uniref:hypothetical protein n=1 Tax=Archangium violaceum TaxID=83451 RepID=UPI00193B2B32|nr:hypothetical protein [Archangium violaceum]QRK07219.1 hypothetical protein JQX13_45465 [Archangium violaceum]
MSGQDEFMSRIAEAIDRSQRGDREVARQLFADIWKDLTPRGEPFHRCTLAHYMADVQDDPHEELLWDLRALDAAEQLTEERARAFQPSLHLNLAEDYRKLGDLARAKEHVARAEAAADALDEDGYGRMIRAGIERLARQLG